MLSTLLSLEMALVEDKPVKTETEAAAMAKSIGGLFITSPQRKPPPAV